MIGSLAGCPFQFSGPAAGLTVVVYEICNASVWKCWACCADCSADSDRCERLEVGPMISRVSPAVIKGVLAGIGVLIFASQFHVMVDDNPKGHIHNLVTIPRAIWKRMARAGNQ